ncbi:MAG: MBG domain-containing protein [Isosphaeraceae bacterium]
MTVPRASAALGVALVLSLLPAGCGSGGPVMGRVSGTVKYNGKPIEKGTISFTPTDGQRPSATGTITNGSYTLQTTEPGDGAAVGEYKVSFSDIDAAQLNTDMPGMPVKIAKGALPKKYLDPGQSGKTAKVEKGSNTINFDLD